jgi:RND family efflux transporter MFP subunit
MSSSAQSWTLYGVVGVGAAVCVAVLVSPATWPKANPQTTATTQAIEVVGRTQCTPQGKAIIAPVPLHPVEEVLVAVGDRVKKGQPLVKIDADEQKAEVRAKKAWLLNAGIALKEARRLHEAIEKSAVIPEQKRYEARAAALKAEMDERAAKAAVDSAEAELEHYTVVAPIDGVVNSLNVHVGLVSRPGTTIWGEILNLDEIDVRCELSPEQVDHVAIGQTAEIRSAKTKETLGVGKVIFVGFSADRSTGLVPVVLRLPNPKWKLRCEVPVQVHFVEAPGHD